MDDLISHYLLSMNNTAGLFCYFSRQPLNLKDGNNSVILNFPTMSPLVNVILFAYVIDSAGRINMFVDENALSLMEQL